MGNTRIIKNNWVFIGCYLSFLSFGCLLLICLGKTETFYFLNPFHFKWLNYIFYFFTVLGDGFFCVPLAFSLLFIRQKKLFWLILSSYILSGIIVLILKNFISEARPAVYDALKHYPNFIENITLHNYHGFPSGHTATAFALATVLAFNSNSKYLVSMILLIVAALVGYSRVYLGEHFISDVMAGSVIGFLSGVICWLYINNKMPNQ